MKNILLLITAVILTGFTTIKTEDNFCSGWEAGYQQALDDCLRVALTPLCPLEPINSNGYKTGFGMGYATAQLTYCE